MKMGCGVSVLPLEAAHGKRIAAPSIAETAPLRNGSPVVLGSPDDASPRAPTAAGAADTAQAEVARRPTTALRPAGPGPNSNVLSGDLYQRHFAKRMRKQKLHRRRLERSMAAESYSENVMAQSDRLSARSLSSRASRIGGYSTRMCTPATDYSGASNSCDDNEVMAGAATICRPMQVHLADGPIPQQGNVLLSTEVVHEQSQRAATPSSDEQERPWPDQSGDSLPPEAATQPPAISTELPVAADEPDQHELRGGHEQSVVEIVAEPGFKVALCETMPLPELELEPERAER